jgi:hypothetical protein
MDLAGFAAAVRGIAERCGEGLALESCRMGSREYLHVLQMETPVRTGALRSSEHVWSVSGGGAEAVALAGPDIIYDKFRNDGGTITRKLPPPHVLGKFPGPYFGHSVTQKGAHYMEKSRGPGQEALSRACKVVADEMIELP